MKTSSMSVWYSTAIYQNQEAGVVLWALGNVNGGQGETQGEGLTTNSPKPELRAGTGARTRLGAGFGAGL